MISLIIKKHLLKFKKGKGSLSIPLGDGKNEELGDEVQGRRDIKPTPSSYKLWNQSLTKSK